MTKIFCYNNKMFSSINKTVGCCSKISVCSNKNIFVVPNFVAVTKPFFPVRVNVTHAVVCQAHGHEKLKQGGTTGGNRNLKTNKGDNLTC